MASLLSEAVETKSSLVDCIHELTGACDLEELIEAVARSVGLAVKCESCKLYLREQEFLWSLNGDSVERYTDGVAYNVSITCEDCFSENAQDLPG